MITDPFQNSLVDSYRGCWEVEAEPIDESIKGREDISKLFYGFFSDIELSASVGDVNPFS